jgi:N-acetylglucosaminyl-diphospho-decaprenol L-rhamnosyltransferase
MDNRHGSQPGEDRESLLIAILCYRVVDLTINCLKSIAPQIHDVPRVRVMICENGTGPEAVDRLRESILENGWEDWVKLQAVYPNVGFTGGNNVILRDGMSWQLAPKYFLLLNADTIVEPGALRALYDAIERAPDIGIMGPTMIGGDGDIQVSCFRDHSPISEFLRGASTGIINRLLLRSNFQLAPPVGAAHFDWVSFACAVIRSEVIEQVGFLDEGYFLYFDDADYCRMARKAGWKIGYCREARVMHLEGQSNEVPEQTKKLERRPRYYYVSRARYFAKHCGMLGLWAANIAWSAGSAIAAARRLASRRGPRSCDGEWRDNWTNAWAPIRNSNAALTPKDSRLVV